MADLDDLRRLSRLLDAAVRIPGTRLRVGLDPLVGLIPGVGDVVTPLFTGLVLLHAWRRRVPKVVMVRMLVNAGLDALLGAVPIVGDVVDVFWKAASANVRLLERHARPGVPPRAGDWLVVLAAAGAVVLLALLPLAALVWLLAQVPRF